MSKNFERKVEELKTTQELPVEEVVEEAETTAEPIPEVLVEEFVEEATSEVEEVVEAEPVKEEVVKPADGHLMQKTVNVGILNIRSSQSTDAPIVRMIKKGDVVTVKSIVNGWAELVDGNYVMSQFIE